MIWWVLLEPIGISPQVAGMYRFLLVTFLLLAACNKDETVSGFVDPAQTYRLIEIDGVPFSASATIQFPEPGQVNGNGPCNSYGGEQFAPYPWLEFGPLRTTRRDCNDRDAEHRFFAALSNMTEVEVFADTLVLRSEDREMVFTASHP